MSTKNKAFNEKHGSDVKINPAIEDEIIQRSKNDQLPCALAFQIAKALNIAPSEVGITTDLLNIELSKCQMGLFGYKPNKKIVKSLSTINPDLKQAIDDALADNRLPCAVAWEIAQDCNVSKMTVSNTCETLGIKIKPCQLGAF